jgi:STE24 endopeptidase
MTYVLNFDVERQHKAKCYFYSGLSSSLAKALFTATLAVTAIAINLPTALHTFIKAYFTEQALVLGAFIIIGFGLYLLVSFPFDYYKEYHLEHKYELSTTTIGKYLKNKLKTSMVTLFLVLAFFEVAYNFTRFSLTWVFAMLVIMVVFVVFLSFSSSALIETRLYDGQKLRDKEMIARFSVLTDKAGLKSIQVYKMNIQKKTEKALADSSGTAKARKISLSDTLLANFSKDEVESIFGHEIGHHKHGHQLKFSILFASVVACALAGSYIIAQFTSVSLGLGPAGSITSLPLLVLVFGLIYASFTPLTNVLNRHAENQCDQYELDLVKKPNEYISSLVKLSDQNLIYAYPNRFIEFFFYDHPSSQKRVKRATKQRLINSLLPLPVPV